MKPLRIILINFIVLLAIAAGIFSYNRGMQQSYHESSLQAIEYNAQGMQETAYTYMLGEQNVVDSWASYINAAGMTIDEAREFTAAAQNDSHIYAHILWADSFEGLSSVATAGTEDDYAIVYSDTKYASVDYARSTRESVTNLNFTDEDVHVTASYVSPSDGARVISFVQKIVLLDEGQERDAYLLRVIPVSYAKNLWTFAAEYDTASIALIEPGGTYIIQPAIMKNSNFFEFIYSYNKGSIDIDALKEELSSADNGSFNALNAAGEEMFFAYDHLSSADGWLLILAIPQADTYTDTPDITVTWIILGLLVVLLLFNLWYFVVTGRKEAEAAATMQEQLNTITEQGQQLSLALASAQEANRAKTVFLNNMSHDIRTPMNAIIGFTNLAINNFSDQIQVREYLDKISTSSNHLLLLINDVLDMSRIESGKVTIEEKEVHLPDILHDLRTIVQSDIHSRQLEFHIDARGIVHEDVLCDQLRLNQVLLNLLSNAIKFTNPGGMVSLHVSEAAGEDSGTSLFEFRVKDTGIGMSKEFCKKVFEPFERERTSTVSGIQGTGLGMAIAKNIVEMMQGEISVESELGVGTEFTVRIPLRTGTHKVSAEALEELKGLPVLIIDDDEDSCTTVAKMLEELGLVPAYARSARDGIAMAEKSAENGAPFRFVFLDLIMPEMGGIEAAPHLREILGEDAPIILMTAYDWTDIEAEARTAGISHFCAKPLFLSELRALLTRSDTAEENKEEEPDFSGKKILLVEDNALNTEIAVAILEDVGFEIDTADDGSVAVEKLSKAEPGRYDLVLMDIQMPIMDGYEATRAIRAMDRPEIANIPIIAMTANAFQEDRQQALDAGMNGHIAKPINVPALYQTLSAILK